LELACLTPIDGGEPIPPVPNDVPAVAPLPPKLVAWRRSLDRTLKVLRAPRQLRFGGLLLACPAIATGEDGASPILDTGRSANAGGALCWRRGAAPLRILTRAPTADPGVPPWKSGESGTFNLATGLPTLQRTSKLNSYPMHSNKGTFTAVLNKIAPYAL
jgi:hypothetical protein